MEKERGELVPCLSRCHFRWHNFFLDPLSGDCQNVSSLMRGVQGEACKFRFNSLLSFFSRRERSLKVLLSVVSQPNDEEEKEEQYLLVMTVISSYPDGRSG